MSTVDGTLVDCNPTFARMLGYDSPAEACEHLTTEYYSKPEARIDLLSRIRTQKRIELHEETLKRRDGSLLQILENVVGHFDEAGELSEIHGFVIDVTDRRRLEHELHHSQKLQAVGQLAGGIAHDFNNLLTAMKRHGEFVLDDMAEGDPRRADILEPNRIVRRPRRRARAPGPSIACARSRSPRSLLRIATPAYSPLERRLPCTDGE
ncbi:MAG: PAS domain S-box protein [Gemmatimonadaceae bacterium]